MKIYVVGGRGFVGGSCLRLLKTRHTVISDPTNSKSVSSLQFWTSEFIKYQPDAVIMAAGRVSKFEDLDTQSALLYSLNSELQIDVIQGASLAGVSKLVYLSSSAVYDHIDKLDPVENDLSISNFDDLQMYPRVKLEGMKLCEQLSKKGLNFHSVIASNLYGEGDSFDPSRSLFIASLIYRVSQALRSGMDYIEMSGHHGTLRDYLYISDLVKSVEMILESDQHGSNWNVGSRKMHSNIQVSEIISGLMSYSGTITFARKEPEKMIRKRMNTEKISGLGWRSETNFLDGIKTKIEYYNKL